MKKNILAFALAFTFATGVALAQETAKPATAPAATPVDAKKVLKFVSEEHNFGEIPRNVPATATFEFTNISDKPVSLANVAGSCGCTVPAWDKNPVAPKKKSKVSATYNAANPGAFTKTVTVTTDNGASYTLYIKGTVVDKAATTPAAPSTTKPAEH